ncbi:MAG: hypothetical protein ACKON8_10370 [Planctomycetota bacterium]
MTAVENGGAGRSKMVLAGWWWQVARHQSEYRAVAVRWPWIVGQAAAFAGVLAVLGSLSKAPFQEVLFEVRSLLLLAVPATAWLFCSAAAVAPRPRLAAELLVTTLLCGVFGAATVGLSYPKLRTSEPFCRFLGGPSFVSADVATRGSANGRVVKTLPLSFHFRLCDLRSIRSAECFDVPATM